MLLQFLWRWDCLIVANRTISSSFALIATFKSIRKMLAHIKPRTELPSTVTVWEKLAEFDEVLEALAPASRVSLR